MIICFLLLSDQALRLERSSVRAMLYKALVLPSVKPVAEVIQHQFHAPGDKYKVKSQAP